MYNQSKSSYRQRLTLMLSYFFETWWATIRINSQVIGVVTSILRICNYIQPLLKREPVRDSTTSFSKGPSLS